MSNLTIAVDEAVIKLARIRAIQEGTSVSARLREFLAAYAAGETGPLTTREERPGFGSTSTTAAALLPSSGTPGTSETSETPPTPPTPLHPQTTPAPRGQPAWLHTLRARVDEFGGLEPAEWLAPRETSGPRPVDFGA